jgi:hypothetical protein
MQKGYKRDYGKSRGAGLADAVLAATAPKLKYCITQPDGRNKHEGI